MLISGNTGDLDVSTAALVAAGRGKLESSTLMVNGYYDFNNNSAITPNVGLGIGTAMTDLEFSPSGAGVLNDDDRTFVYQLILGASYTFTDSFKAFASYHYRDADEASIERLIVTSYFRHQQ